MSSLVQFKHWIDQHRSELKEDYFHFLRFQTISADPTYAKEIELCAKWLCDYIVQKTGMKGEIIPTTGYPLVYAEDLRAGPSAPTLLIYGHYDVQPVDPLELWDTPPFEPTERTGQIFARGAVDDKGQIFYAIAAVRGWKELGMQLPINLKFCIEGEEESSSLGLTHSLPKLKEKLKADALLVVDFDQFDSKTPALSLGARGIVSMEITLTGSKSDLHSGIHGGLAYNPNKALVQLLSKLWDEQGRVRVEGFYDGVLETTEEERSRFAFRFDQKSYQDEFGIGALGGEKHRSMAENNLFQPTLEINGIGGGYVGAGFKTVIPSEAVAKISVRLVPNQDPEKVGKLIAHFLEKNVTAGMKLKVTHFEGARAFRGDPHSSLAKAVTLASSEVMNTSCKNVLCAASIPVVAKLVDEMKLDVVGMGYGLATDNIHAPNEHFDWSRFEHGLLTVARTLELL